MVEWSHQHWGSFYVYVSNAKECSKEDYLYLFDHLTKRFTEIRSLVVLNDLGEQCVFHGDVIREGMFRLKGIVYENN